MRRKINKLLLAMGWRGPFGKWDKKEVFGDLTIIAIAVAFFAFAVHKVMNP